MASRTGDGSGGIGRLSAALHTAATVELYDETDGIFGELIYPQAVLSSLSLSDRRQLQSGAGGVDNLVGRVDDPSHATADAGGGGLLAFRSLSLTPTAVGAGAGSNDEIGLEFDNASDLPVRIRWIDEGGRNDPLSHRWTVGPSSTAVQYTRPGHLFVMSILVSGGGDSGEDLFYTEAEAAAEEQELVLGGYRPLRGLPSGSPHCVLVQGGAAAGGGVGDGNVVDGASHPSFVLETILLDGTKRDALVVAASDLDPVSAASSSADLVHRKERTVETLRKIVSNVVRHPTEEKYRKLRLGNPKIRREISESWGATQMLRVLGFRSVFLPRNAPPVATVPQSSPPNHGTTEVGSGVGEDGASQPVKMTGTKERDNPPDPCGGPDEEEPDGERERLEEFLFRSDPPSRADLEGPFRLATDLLDVLSGRCSSSSNGGTRHFVAELAPPTPWERPSLAAVGGGGGGTTSRWNTRGTHFVTDDERWARADRQARLRRGGGGRRPPPGQAPSSRGAWGR